MESNLDQLERLQKEGSEFTFDNFSYRSQVAQFNQWGGRDSPKWLAWKTRVANIIHALLDKESAPVAVIMRALEIRTEGNDDMSFLSQQSLMLSAVAQTIQILQEDVFGETKRPKAVSSSGALSNRIFVVHGHDNALKTELEVFLTGIGLEPIVLHRQPDQGHTLIEKFEHHADVGFAFILFTPDDVAYSADEGKLPDENRKKEFRARPNVTFEFGYFVGKLGRSRVCCLIKGDVARPSDIDGLVYKPIPESIEAIGFSIVRELKAAGYTLKI